MPLLAEKKLVESFKGKHGGYKLTLKPDQICVADILEAVEGPLALIECVVDESSCKKAENCPAKNAWSIMSEEVATVYKKFTIDQFI